MAGWITVNGTHIYLKDGESVEEAFSRTTGNSLSTKGNPSQTDKATKFSINDALKKASNERGRKEYAALNKAMREGDKMEAARNEGVLRKMGEEETEAKNLTEAGKQARQEREQKQVDKFNSENHDKAAAAQEKANADAKSKLSSNIKEHTSVKAKADALYKSVAGHSRDSLVTSGTMKQFTSDISKVIGRDVYFDGGSLVDAVTQADIGPYLEMGDGENDTVKDFCNQLADYENSDFYKSVKGGKELAKYESKGDVDSQRKCMDIIKGDKNLKTTCEIEIEKDIASSINYAYKEYKNGQMSKKDFNEYKATKDEDLNDLKGALNSGNMESIWRLDTVVRDSFWDAVKATANQYGKGKKK